ncbi:MAG: hypothetical protein RL115_1622 [Bacteroidota bacterium]|jgi:hypothetical protein
MHKIFLALLTLSFFACKNNSQQESKPAPFFSAKEIVQFNQLIYKDSIEAAILKNAPAYQPIFIPTPIGGNYAVIVKAKKAQQYALVIRGSVMEFSNEGFQNFIIQDFNIFKIKKWPYSDTTKEAYLSNGAWIGFQNLLQLRDVQTGLSIKEFIEQKIPSNASLVITGHSLGGNLAYPLAGFLKKMLATEKKLAMQLITFGAPAAGNAAFVQDMEDKFPDAERYVAAKDIAPAFPDTEKIAELAYILGLDSVVQLGNLNLSGISKELNAKNLLNIANEILEKTNVINKTNKYVQSQKHLRLLTITDSSASVTPFTVDAIFNKAYQFHKVDMYAELLGSKKIE